MSSAPEEKKDRCPQCGVPLSGVAAGGLCPACLLKRGLESNTGGPGPRIPFTPPPIEEIASHFPDLEVTELLGHGGMGAVYKARQKDLDRDVAVKILPPAVSDDPAFADRFAREAKALARLNHPNIVTIHSFGQAKGLFYFVMEYVDGVHLRQLMHGGRVAPREALAIVPQICDALQYAHDHGIVHRDIKPENILVDQRGNVKVADFGVAKLVETAESAITGQEPVEPCVTEPGRVMGTPQYMAPEQREHPTEVDHRADVYALGVVFYQMLTGELPDKLPVAPSKKVAVDVRLDEVVLRALEQNPARRYGQVSEVKTRLEDIAAAPPEHTMPLASPPQPSTPARPSRFSRFAIWGAVWACFFPLLPMMFAGRFALGGIGTLELFVILFLFPPGLVALTAPLGSTLLGWIAVTQIRSASGRLHGLGLALFAALTFPLLVFNGLMGFISLLLLRASHVFAWLPITRWGAILLFCGLALVWVFISILIVRRIGRWARTPAGAIGQPTQASSPSRRSPRMVSVLVTVAWHSLLFLGVTLFFVYFVPRYVSLFANLDVELPVITQWSINLARVLMGWGLLALPLLLFLDAGAVWLFQYLGGRRGRNLWSLFVVLGCIALVVSSAAALYLPFRGVMERIGGDSPADAAAGRGHRVPSSAHIGSVGGTVMVHHRDGKAEYVVYYPGDFSHSGGTQHNTRSLVWYEDVNVHLESGTTFGYTRESVDSNRVRINGREFLLLIGRVFVLHDDGTVEQFSLSPDLETARAPEAVRALVTAEEALSSPKPVTLHDLDTPRANAFDLETGRVLDVPRDLAGTAWTDSRLVEWMRESNAHIVAAFKTDHWEVKTVDAVMGRVAGARFDQVTAKQLRGVATKAHRMSYSGGINPGNVRLESQVHLRENGTGTHVFAFRTLSGASGAVQLRDAESAPPSLALLHKRLQAGSLREAPERTASLTLNHLDMPFSNALDLDTGRALDVPGDLLLSAWTEPRQLEWMRHNGAHVIAAYWTNHWAVKLVDATLAPLVSVGFEEATPADVRNSIEHMADAPSAHGDTDSPARPDDMNVIMSFPTKSLAGQVFAFRTGAGAEGVVQVEKAESVPPALHLRYRRLRDVPPATARLIGAAASEERWQWSLDSPRPARLVYGLVEVLDDGQYKPLLSGVDEHPARPDGRTLGLWAEPDGGKWRIHLLDEKHRRMNVADEATAGPAIGLGAGSGPTDFRGATFGERVELPEDAYRVLWQGEIMAVAKPGSPAKALRRFALVARTSDSGSLPHLVLGPYDRVDNVMVPPGTGALQRRRTTPPGATASRGHSSQAEEAVTLGETAPVAAEFRDEDESRDPISSTDLLDRVIQFRENGSTNAFLDLDTGELMTPPPDIARAIEERKGQPLQTWDGSNDERHFVDWVRREGVDMWLYGPEALRVAGGKFVTTHGPDYRTWNDLDSLTPGAGRSALARHSITGPPGSELLGLGPIYVISRKRSVVWYFETRNGAFGVLEIVGPSEDPRGTRIRYKLLDE